MIRILVLPPYKTSTRYEFQYVIKQTISFRRAFRVLSGRAVQGKTRAETFKGRLFRFGFTSDNFEIPHHKIWDSIYPLMFLTRNGGPLFGKHTEATIEFKYPIHSLVRDFYIKRAFNFGISITIKCKTYNSPADIPTKGHILSLGGGKDSRLLLGMLREQNKQPLVVASGAENAMGIEGALTTTPINNALVNRIMPALMQCPEILLPRTCPVLCALP